MITLEVSSTEIRLMESLDGKVIKWITYPLEAGMLDADGVISEPQALGVTIRQLITMSGMNGRDVIAGVSGLYSLSRIVTVPTPSRESITRQAVMEAVGQAVPLSEDEIYLSWQTIAVVGDAQRVLVVAMPRSVIDSEMSALNVAGLKTRTLDLKAMALIRAVNKQQALIINIEPTGFDMILVVDGAPEVVRTRT